MGIATFKPKDRTAREHLGQVSRVVWADDDQPFVILRLADNASALGPAASTQFEPHQLYRFHGRWKDGKHGPEFAFDTFTRDRPLSRDAVVKYLTDTCRNVGKVTAERLVAKFGADALRLLREEPGSVADAGLLSPAAAEEASQDLARFAQLEHTRVELFGLFHGRGFPRGTLIDRCIGKWGASAPAVVERDPFKLLVNKLPGCGFKRCDKMHLDLGKPTDSRKRQACAVWSAMREDRTGSTWLDAADVVDSALKAIPTADPVRALQVLARAGWVRIRRDGDRRYVAVREVADAEQRIADNVKRLTARPASWPAAILTTKADGDGLPSEHQGEQLATATAQAVGCFVGGPGTGKTHSLSFLLKQVIAEHGPDAVAVAAPTGKASVRAGESLRARGLDIHASTIHQLLEIGNNGHADGDWRFQRNRDNPLAERFVVVDESSMIDVRLMADLLDAIPTGGCVLLVGDPFQLPPVGAGAPLRDLLAAGVAAGELTEVRRNAGAIVRGCADIKAGQPVRFSERVDLDAADPANLRHLDCPAGEALDLIDAVLDQVPGFGFDVQFETQIITALNEKSDLSRTKLNERFGKRLNPDGHGVAGNKFRVGDKVICLRNSRLKTCVPTGKFGRPDMALDAGWYQEPPAGQREQYVANGEIGRVVAVSEKETVARFGGADAPLVKFKHAKKKPAEAAEAEQAGGGADDFDLAWAITVHRSQGSEWPVVVTLIDAAGGAIADRNFWYTAVSRARSLSIAIGPRTVFDAQVRRQSLVRRRTFLADLIREGK